jgi:predicted nuclease of predicted toxin-antitoxin system
VTATGSTDAAPPRLLFDQNLAPSLPHRLADLYPGSTHVRDVGLAAADDEAIWSHALEGGYIIVTKDDDFRQRSFLRGAPPKIIWTRLGNCATSEIEDALRSRHGMVESFAADTTAALLVIARP